MKRIVEFLFEAGMLKKTPRTGFQFLGSGGESVAGHSFRVAVIAFALATMEPDADSNRAVLLSLFHDLPEARTGDHNYVNKRYVAVDEGRALQDQIRGLPFGAELASLHREFTDGESLEARISRDADQLDLILELKEQLDVGNANARDWLTYAVQRLETAAAKEAAQTALDGHFTDWWFHKDTDWWVNGPKNGRRNGDSET